MKHLTATGVETIVVTLPRIWIVSDDTSTLAILLNLGLSGRCWPNSPKIAPLGSGCVSRTKWIVLESPPVLESSRVQIGMFSFKTR